MPSPSKCLRRLSIHKYTLYVHKCIHASTCTYSRVYPKRRTTHTRTLLIGSKVVCSVCAQSRKHSQRICVLTSATNRTLNCARCAQSVYNCRDFRRRHRCRRCLFFFLVCVCVYVGCLFDAYANNFRCVWSVTTDHLFAIVYQSGITRILHFKSNIFLFRESHVVVVGLASPRSHGQRPCDYMRNNVIVAAAASSRLHGCTAALSDLYCDDGNECARLCVCMCTWSTVSEMGDIKCASVLCVMVVRAPAACLSDTK